MGLEPSNGAPLIHRMVCVLDVSPGGELKGWIIATSIPHARNHAVEIGQFSLGEALGNLPILGMKPGRYTLSTGHTMLVQ